jgi:acylphosphatase
MAENQTRRWLISGRVQGVFFRESTRRQAEALGLTGHALNLSDGRVEVLAHGPIEPLGALEAWLEKGPPGARVDAVQRVEVADDRPDPEHFMTG